MPDQCVVWGKQQLPHIESQDFIAATCCHPYMSIVSCFDYPGWRTCGGNSPQDRILPEPRYCFENIDDRQQAVICWIAPSLKTRLAGYQNRVAAVGRILVRGNGSFMHDIKKPAIMRNSYTGKRGSPLHIYVGRGVMSQERPRCSSKPPEPVPLSPDDANRPRPINGNIGHVSIFIGNECIFPVRRDSQIESPGRIRVGVRRLWLLNIDNAI